jgi:hypothetical protein
VSGEELDSIQEEFVVSNGGSKVLTELYGERMDVKKGLGIVSNVVE